MASIVPTRLRCNLLHDPLVIADERPRLSWALEHAVGGVQNAKQTAYRVLVSTHERGDADLWDSGRVGSPATLDIVYEGSLIEPFQTAYWRVIVWDENREESEQSHTAQWTQAPDAWPAKWIGYDAPLERERPISLESAHWIWHEDESAMKSPPGICYFQKEIILSEPSEVEIFASADDVFALLVDGEEWCRSDNELHSWSHPQRVARHLSAGKHVIEAEVKNKNVGAGAFIAKVRAPKLQEVVTDETWQARKQESQDWKGSQKLVEYGCAPWGHLRESDEFLPPPREFLQEFVLDRPVRRAVLYATALGLHDFSINNKAAQDDWFAPGWTDYDKRVHYRAYDVSRLLQAGENRVAATLFDGWYAGYVGFKPERRHYGEKTRLSAFIRIEYEDGGHQMILTDKNWRARVSAIKQSDFLMGEVRGSVNSDWDKVVFEDGIRKPEPYPMQPARTYAVVPAKRVKRIGDATIYDLGQNFAGVSRLRLDYLEQGQRVTMRHAEMLSDDGSIYTENLRSARATDVIIGEGGPVDWTPRGTFHGYRYVELSGIEQAPLNAITGLTVSNITEKTAQFECSDARLNKLWKNVEWTQRSNFIEVPTDCPQRDERLGWTGDIQMYARTASLFADVQAFLRKWLVDLSDAQRSDGQYPMVAPLKVAGDDGGPAWSEAGVIVPWELYQVYEDKGVLQRQWGSMVEFMSFSESRSPNGRAPQEYHCFGDWLNVGEDTPNEVIFTAYFARSAYLMARIAGVIGQDGAHYQDLYRKACATFAHEYVAEDGTVRGDTQTGYVLALAFDLLEKPLQERVAKKLVENIERRGHLTTGFVGTKDLMLALRDIGRTDLAYDLLLSDDYPGWLFSLKQGATTVWERWNGWTPEDGFADPVMNSFSHYAYGAVGQFMMETIGGIRPLEPGYKKILIAPDPGPLTSCRARYESVRGQVSVEWTVETSGFRLYVEVPPNTEAIIRLPGGEEKLVGSGKWSF